MPNLKRWDIAVGGILDLRGVAASKAVQTVEIVSFITWWNQYLSNLYCGIGIIFIVNMISFGML